ncbi:CoA transferase [Bosea sp. NPDC055594]
MPTLLYDVGIANLNYMAAWALNRDFVPSRLARSAHPTLGPCQLFKTADGWIYIMANKEKFFPRLCERLERPDLVLDPRFQTFSDRQSHRQVLSDILDSIFVQCRTAQWLERLAGAVPAAPVANMAAALASDFTNERGMIMRLEAENGASLSVIGSPFVTGEAVPQRAAPILGRHTDALLAEAGITADEIDDLRSRGIAL